MKFSIEGSENSPEVMIDANFGVLEIRGNSTLMAPEAFYKQVARWIHAFNLNDPSTKTVNIKFEKIDMRSFQWMLFLLHELEHIDQTKNNKLVINWYYTQNNNQIMNLGIVYRTNSQLPFNLVAA
jgi:Neuraminidase (sialidase)